jgi:murein DD-endopeptidase MepM/ murein hydrolase activator NlpD
VQKIFLKAPVAFKYISSGYTTGNRVIMEYGLSGPHLAIDYAAPIGTPIRTVGDGTVIFAGWKNGYGYFTSVRHNGTYTTNYAHQSKIAVRVGQKVKQGETIGYVGSTGYSTGPHLHFEMVKNGVKINSLKEVLPPGEAIKEENQARFFEAIREWQGILNNF